MYVTIHTLLQKTPNNCKQQQKLKQAGISPLCITQNLVLEWHIPHSSQKVETIQLATS